jgi:hypothetical protein
MSVSNAQSEKMSGSKEGFAKNGDAKITAAFYYYLSLDGVPADEKRKHIEALFNIRQSLIWYLSTLGLKDGNETVPENEGELDKYLAGKISNPEGIENFSIAMPDFDNFKEDVIRHCEETAVGFEDDERYERISEEIDSLLKDSPNGILSYGKLKYLWLFIMYSASASLLTAQRRRFLKHFARITDIDEPVLKEMEETALAFSVIGKKRTDAKKSDDAYSKVIAALSAIDAEEKDALKKLYSLLGTSSNGKCDDDSEDESDDCYNDEDAPILEKMGQGVIDFLSGIADKLDDFANRL